MTSTTTYQPESFAEVGAMLAERRRYVFREGAHEARAREAVARTADMDGRRYREIEEGTARPTDLELRAIAAALQIPDEGLLELLALAPPVQIRPTVLAFAAALELKLRAREHRGEWVGMVHPLAFIHTGDEFGELARAIKAGTHVAIADEAVDLAAQAMIHWDVARASEAPGPVSLNRGRVEVLDAGHMIGAQRPAPQLTTEKTP